jgi:SAM-dependent methyltransferase
MAIGSNGKGNGPLTQRDFAAANATKLNFNDIYTRDDPRDYFRVLGGLDYVIPDVARPIFRQLIEARRAELGRPVTVLDIGCSYGINAALMRYPITFETLYDRYLARGMQELPASEIVELDRHFFASWPKREDVRVIGMDISGPAIEYAVACGLLDFGIVGNFERGVPTPEQCGALKSVDVIVSTGCVGYVTERSFEKLAVCTEGVTPWVASFVLRMFPYEDIEATLARQGLITEKFEGTTFVQRRFGDREEQRGVMEKLRARGINPSGKEADGHYHTELFVSRPKRAAEQCPLQSMISVAAGVNRRYRTRVTRADHRRVASKAS